MKTEISSTVNNAATDNAGRADADVIDTVKRNAFILTKRAAKACDVLTNGFCRTGQVGFDAFLSYNAVILVDNACGNVGAAEVTPIRYLFISDPFPKIFLLN